MDIVGGAANVTQLVAYSGALVQRLVKLYKASSEAPSFCRNQRIMICFLLESVQRISLDDSLDIDIILPILVGITGLANSLLDLLEPKGIWYRHLHWISKGTDIDNGLRALNDKTHLLQLHMTERTHRVVARVHTDIERLSSLLKGPSEDQDKALTTMPSTSQQTQQRGVSTLSNPSDYAGPGAQGVEEVNLKVSGNKATGTSQQSVGNGWGAWAQRVKKAAINVEGNQCERSSQQVAGNVDATPFTMEKRT